MSDGMTDSRREEDEFKRVDKAIRELDKALAEVHDSIFGLPGYARARLEETLRKYHLGTVER